ncbi:MAG: hypothetical protein HYV63_06545 [Candidatus Schekmanbacteria bacterium]|nr:hypothetical protein [Candidatus Schekmanbacteria bacterium]
MDLAKEAKEALESGDALRAYRLMKWLEKSKGELGEDGEAHGGNGQDLRSALDELPPPEGSEPRRSGRGSSGRIPVVTADEGGPQARLDAAEEETQPRGHGKAAEKARKGKAAAGKQRQMVGPVEILLFLGALVLLGVWVLLPEEQAPQAPVFAPPIVRPEARIDPVGADGKPIAGPGSSAGENAPPSTFNLRHPARTADSFAEEDETLGAPSEEEEAATSEPTVPLAEPAEEM